MGPLAAIFYTCKTCAAKTLLRTLPKSAPSTLHETLVAQFVFWLTAPTDKQMLAVSKVLTFKQYNQLLPACAERHQHRGMCI